MIIEVLKSKLHRAKVTQAELNYVGSITIDEDLMDAANIIANEKVQIVNNNNGARFETYVIRGERGSDEPHALWVAGESPRGVAGCDARSRTTPIHEAICLRPAGWL